MDIDAALPPDRLVGRRYRIDAQLGAGGMGEVFRAYDRLTGETIALKRVITPTDRLAFANRSEAADQLYALANEFSVLASLWHPHVIGVLDYGFESGQPYYTMRLIDQARTITEAGRDRSAQDKIALIVQLLHALAYLHRRGVIHRDLKPSNILVTPEGQVNVMDFGLAVMQGHGDPNTTSGTLAYMSPEVLSGSAASPASDLFAVGIIAYEMLVGTHPFYAEDASTILQNILYRTPDLRRIKLDGDSPSHPENAGDGTSSISGDLDDLVIVRRTNEMPSAPLDLDTLADAPQRSHSTAAEVIGRLLEKQPTARYTSAREAAEALITAAGTAAKMTASQETQALRESYLQAAAFIGREDELAALVAALDSASKGLGSGWLILGESGIGKSRLIRELRTQALVGGAHVLEGSAHADSAPYRMWEKPLRELVLLTEPTRKEAELLKCIVHDLDRLWEQQVSRADVEDQDAFAAQLTQVVTRLIVEQPTPVCLLLEDLHRADAPSLALLDALAAGAAAARLLIVGAWRSDEGTPPSSLARLTPMPLTPLAEDDLSLLLRSMLGDASSQPDLQALIQRETEGNVLFVTEIVRSLVEEAGGMDKIGQMPLPEHIASGGIDAILRRRFARYSRAERLPLELAAVMGRVLDLNVLGSADAPDGWLAAYLDAGILEVNEGEWRFAHDRLRDVLVADMDIDAYRKLHLLAGLLTEQTYPDRHPAIAADMAHHAREGGDLARESYYTGLLGEQAYNLARFEEAVSLYRRALECFEGEDADRGGLLLRLGRALLKINDSDAAEAAFRDAAEFSRSAPTQAAMAVEGAASVELARGNRTRAVELLQSSLKLYEALNSAIGQARVLNRLGGLAIEMGDEAAAVSYYQRALQLRRNR